MTSLALVAGLVCTALAALGYLGRYEMDRPPIGVYTFPDIAVMAVAVAIVPVLYTHIPVAAIGTLFGLVLLVVLRATLQPILPGPRATIAAIALLAGDAGLSMAGATGVTHSIYLLTNDLALGIAVLGIANLYVQSGMRAVHVAVFAALLAVYDYIATAVLPTTVDLVNRLAGRPFAPQIVVGTGTNMVGAGLGDALMLVLWALVAAKAFGRLPGYVGALVGAGSIGCILLGIRTGLITGAVPAMVVLGPLTVGQYLGWRTRRGTERPWQQWRAGTEPSTAAIDDNDAFDKEVRRLVECMHGRSTPITTLPERTESLEG